MAVFFADNFIDAVQTNITSHVPTNGASWESELSCFVYTDNFLRCSVVTTLSRLRKNDDLGDDEMTVSIYYRTATGASKMGVCARMAASDFNNQFEAYISTGTNVVLDKVVGGVRTQLASAALSPGTLSYTLTLFVGSGVQRVYHSGVVVLSATEANSTLAGNTRAGMLILGAGTSSSNVKVKWYIANTTPTSYASLDNTDPIQAAISALYDRASSTISTISGRMSLTQYPELTDAGGTYGSYTSNASTNWTAGFFPGMLYNMYAYTGNALYLNAALSRQDGMEIRKSMLTTHDLGFMFMPCFHKGLTMTGQDYFRGVLLTAASSLDTRYSSPSNIIDTAFPSTSATSVNTIVDELVGAVPLMLYAASNGGTASWGSHAITHLSQTIANHIRSDDSSYHVVDYDTTTGAVVDQYTAQGEDDESTWSRGQSWLMWGLSDAYERTQTLAYLVAARRVADYALAHNPAADPTPPWDYEDPALDSPPADAELDSSAGAVMAYAFLKLGVIEIDATRRATYRQAAKNMLLGLLDHVSDGDPATEALMLHASRAEDEHDMGLIYADYYMLESVLYYVDTITAIPDVVLQTPQTSIRFTGSRMCLTTR